MSELKNKTIITVATTGAWPTKANNPNVPMTPEEISEDVYACWKAGAAIAHLHMRDDEGHGTMDKEKFRKTVELLRANHPDCDHLRRHPRRRHHPPDPPEGAAPRDGFL